MHVFEHVSTAPHSPYLRFLRPSHHLYVLFAALAYQWTQISWVSFSWPLTILLIWSLGSWLYMSATILEESIVVIRDLGVQIRRTYASGKHTAIFIEKARIQDLVMIEGIKSYCVIYYIAFILNDTTRMILPFEVSFDF